MKQTEQEEIIRFTGNSIYEACAATRSYENIALIQSLLNQLKLLFEL